jgi:hypothetical protein
MTPMVRGPFGQKIAAILTLTLWIGFAGGDEAVEILAQALGVRGTCQMACCRKHLNGTATATDHHGHLATSEDRTPASSFSIVNCPAVEAGAVSSSEQAVKKNSSLRLALPDPWQPWRRVIR